MSSVRPSVIEPNGHEFSDNLSFQSSPELHCVLFHVLLWFRPASRVSSLTISSTLFLLSSVEAVRGRPLRGWSWMLVFPSFKMLYPSSNTTSTRAHISIHTLKSVVNISSGNLLFNKEFNVSTLTKRNIVVGHFVSLVYGHVMQATSTIPHSKIWK